MRAVAAVGSGALVLGLLVVAACREVEAPRVLSARALADVQVVAVDRGAPAYAFDGGGGSLLLGEGWGRPDRRIVDGSAVTSAWAVGEEAVVRFRMPPHRDVDFYGRCSPFTFPGSTPQTLELVLAGAVASPAVTLRPGWQELRIGLPSDRLPAAGAVELGLRFARATSPHAAGVGPDRRRLAAACRELAVVPRAVAGAAAFVAAARWDPVARRASLPRGGALALPLPVARRSALRLTAVASSCTGCSLAVEVHGAGAVAEPVWSGRPTALGGHSLQLPAGREVVVRVVPPPGEPPAPEGVDLVVEALAAHPAEGRPRGRRPHVFLYLVDTLRADAVAPYADRRTPRLRELASRATTYTRAWTPSSWTLPATVSILTGLYPRRHGVMRGDVVLPPSAATLARVLGELGYDTVGISQSFVAGPAFGVDAGFAEFFLDDQLNGGELRSQRIRRYFLDWLLERPREGPIFAYLHTVDPHAPYLPHVPPPGSPPPLEYRPSVFSDRGWADEPRRVARLRDLYQAEVAHADAQLGRFLDLLDHLGLAEDSLVVVLSDHGEEFAEHGGFDHGRTVFEEMLRVPLVVRYPRGLHAGAVVSRRVSTLDVFATVVELAGGDANALGVDSVSLLRSGSGDREPAVFSEVAPVASERLAAVDDRAFARGDVKCIESLAGIDQFGAAVPRWRAFDLSEDAGEERPLADADRRARRCRQEMRVWLATVDASPSPNGSVGESATERLRSLGYVR